MNTKILKVLVVVGALGCASSALAAGTSIVGTVTIGGGSFTPSSKVGLSIASQSTSYAAASAHLNGTYEYGTVGGTGLTGSYTDTSKIYQGDIPSQSGKTIGTPTQQTSATSLAGTWK